ncbi:MAG: hypothetical protein U5R49_27405 [Deltaproteobacteria bacterium]|nr:hypothetical protein [Deltaproteobacteria bacterium]
MSKKEGNLKEIKEYLSDEFPVMELIQRERKGLLEDRPDQFFYCFEVGGKYFLAVIRAMVEEETVFPVLEGKGIAEEMRSHPNAYVIMEKAPAGKGTEVKIKAPAP